MTNLLKETEQELINNGKSLEDICWVGTKSVKLDLDGEGIKRALDINYNSGYGLNEISLEFMVCGNNWWLERHEYDGSEWWEYKEQPVMPTIKTTDPKQVL